MSKGFTTTSGAAEGDSQSMNHRLRSLATKPPSSPPAEREAPSLRFVLDKQSKVPYYDQIKSQCDAALHLGSLQSRARMPTVRELAKMLDINPKTVFNIYHRLEADGVIEIRGGSGARITGVPPGDKLQSDLNSIVTMAERHLAEARRLQLSPQQYLDVLREIIEGTSHNQASCLVVECNTEQIHLFAREIQDQVGLLSHPLLLDDLPSLPQRDASLLNEVSFLVTTDFHWNEVERFARRNRKTALKVRLAPKFFRTLMDCAERGGLLMVVSSLDFFGNFQRAMTSLGYGSLLRRISASLPSGPGSPLQFPREVKYVYVSPLCNRAALPPLPPGVELIRVESHVCPDSLNALRKAILIHHLQQVFPASQPAGASAKPGNLVAHQESTQRNTLQKSYKRSVVR